MNDELTPLLTASIAFALHRRRRVRSSSGVYLSLKRGRLHPLLLVCISAIVDLVDRGALRLGDVRAVPARDPSDAVVVADEHDLGWAAVVGADRLHLLLRAARRDRRGARATG